MDTIFALATARGRAGVSVLRLSGDRAHAAVAGMTASLPLPRQARLRRLRHNGDMLDDALVVLFEAGASFTGEKVAELHLHGSDAVVKAVMRVLAEMPGLRLAEPGEFTRRAFENGCLDLTQVEGLSDLIAAETEAQRKQALRVMQGAIGVLCEGWRKKLIRAAALIEATIDFADEDVPENVRPEVAVLLQQVIHEITVALAGSSSSERIRDGFEVAIVGAPNAGKSTLLNYLAGRDAAITSETAGTTRDIIEVRMDIDGYAVTLLDTAGLRATDDLIEIVGIKRALARAESADLRVVMRAPGDGHLPLDHRDDDIVVASKCDTGHGVGLLLSSRTGQGIQELVAMIGSRLVEKTVGAGLMGRERHRIALHKAVVCLTTAHAHLLVNGSHLELVAADIRIALRALESLIGRVDVEDMLDEVFSSFCIGK